MGKRSKKKPEPILDEVLRSVAPKIGARVIFEPEWRVVGCIIYKSGRRRYFRNSTLDINSMGASEIARDKGYAKYFMRLLGYPVVRGNVFYSKAWCEDIGSKKNIDQAYKYARKLGFPVFVKPNSRSRGVAVDKVCTRVEFYRAMRRVFTKDKIAVVEEAIASAMDYRIVVLDQKVISAYERIPLNVIGNGRSTIKSLLKGKQQHFDKIGRDTRIDLQDPRLLRNLRRLGLTLNSVPEKGRQVFLLDNANLSAGGESSDVTRIIHQDFRKLATDLTRAMGLRLCGVDVLIQGGSIGEPASKFYVLEINSAPGLDHYAKIGREQKRIVENLYLKVIRAMER
jgi:D-alanine-D-alanine ligase-like ATP-grasp enzyme